MYIPKQFEVTDPKVLSAVIREFSFASVITADGGRPFATHLPILLEGEGDDARMVGHMARANPQWRHFANGGETLMIFEGPHGYISPAWYETELAVPTWNYVAVHAYGRPVLIDDGERLQALVDCTVGHYESGRDEPWKAELPADFKDGLLQAIVGFEMPINRMEGKFKLGQNRPDADIRKTVEALRKSPRESERELAEWMERHAPN